MACVPQLCCVPPIILPPGPEEGSAWSCNVCRRTWEAVPIDSSMGGRAFGDAVTRGFRTLWMARGGLYEEVDEEPREEASSADAPYDAANRGAVLIDPSPVRGKSLARLAMPQSDALSRP
jgi:hypothetical protein